MSLRHRLAGPWLAAHRLLRAVSGGGGALRLLLLHDVPPAEMPAFRRLVAWLAQSGRLASPGAEEGCVLTFDDGFASNLEAALVLEEHGARGLFFVCPGLMGLAGAAQQAAVAASVFDGKRGAAGLRLMTWDEVAGLAARGHAIGNHTMGHRRLTLLSEAEIESEVGDAARLLADQLGRPADWFAFPFGDVASADPRVLAAAGRHHRFCRSGVRGANRAGTHRLALRADHVELSAPFAFQCLAVEGGLDFRYRGARKALAAMAAEATFRI